MNWKRLEEIEARAANATEGPWDGSVDRFVGYKTPQGGSGGICEIKTDIRRNLQQAHFDGDFIANARDDIPWLCERLREAERTAAVERERKQIVEEQRLRLARLLRAFDRCEHCRQYRKAHEPGISFCDGFSLGEPADPLETTVAVDPPVSVSEIAEGLVMPSEELHRLAKLSEIVSTASLLGTDVILSGPGYRRVVDVEGLTPEEGQAKVQAELDDIEAWLGRVNAENRDEPPLRPELLEYRGHLRKLHSLIKDGLDEGIAGKVRRDAMYELSRDFSDEEIALVNRWSAEIAATYSRDEPPAECCSEGDAGEKVASSIHRSLNGMAGLH